MVKNQEVNTLTVELRPLNSSDELFLYELLNNKDVTEYGFLTDIYPQSDIQIKGRLQKWLSDQTKKKNLVATIDGKQIGLAQINNIDYVNRKCTFGILVLPEFKSKGYGAMVIQELIHLSFDNLNLRKIELEMAELNKNSIHLFKKFNFELEGVRKNSIYKSGRYQDVHMFGLIKQK